MIIRLAVACATLASPASAFIFSEADQRAYCEPLVGPENFDVWQCIDRNRADFTRAQIILDTAQSDFSRRAIESCERKWRFDWAMIRQCAAKQQVAARRVEHDMAGGDMITKKSTEACMKKHQPDAELIAFCIQVVEKALRAQP